ncbi:hypothetical protein DH2020_001181 [Rehmannia glutinosa]|uniref:DUF4283 domain-containing protein n=1 Tax=Rehmannia glutinosa TaxID=99300 RepID=A0ABR0XYL4_REHGL
MDPEDMARLVEIMKRTRVDDADKLQLYNNTVKIEMERMKGCLLAKVFSNKQMNREIFKTQMPKILQTSKSVEVEAVGDNLFIMEFRSAVDRHKALTEGPWNIFRSLVLFQEVKGLQNLREIIFDKVDIWVQLHNLPMAFMNKRVLETIGGKVGEVLEIDEGEGGNLLELELEWTRTIFSGSSTFNNGHSGSRREERVTPKSDAAKQDTPVKLAQEFEQVLSSGGGMETTSRHALVGISSINQLMDFGLDDRMEEIPETKIAPQASPKLALSSQPCRSGEIISSDWASTGEKGNTSTDTVTSTGRSPKKWKKLARKEGRKRRNDGKDIFDVNLNHTPKKRAIQGEQEDDYKIEATAEVAMQPRREP